MLDRIDTNTVRSLFNLEIVAKDEQAELEELERMERQRARKQAAAMSYTTAFEGAAEAGEEARMHKPYEREQPKVKPNEACPCGSGRKYKKCHGAGM